MDLGLIRVYRKICIKKPYLPNQKTNEPGKRRRDILWRRALPPNPTEDPYIAAVLIAMAQAQRRPTSIQVHSNQQATPDGPSSDQDKPNPQDASPSQGTVPTNEKSSYNVRSFRTS
jgi:hypothetical protein